MKLMPLRIPQGWSIYLNHFTETDIESLDPDCDDDWLFLVQDISLFRRFEVKGKYNIDIDLGWYPEGEPSGSFKIYVIKNYDWDFPLEVFSSRSSKDIADKLEYFFEKYN